MEEIEEAKGFMPGFFNRDISWLLFNDRVLAEAANEDVPLLERLKFLAIYSSNLDEFYRIRMPVLQALHKIEKEDSSDPGPLYNATRIISDQQQRFGKILADDIIPGLKKQGIYVLYNEPCSTTTESLTEEYFFSKVLAFIHPVALKKDMAEFFPENNKLYFLVLTEQNGEEKSYILNIPSDQLPRFYSFSVDGTVYVAFLDDIIRTYLGRIFKNSEVRGCYSFKITRDAELDLADEYSGDQLEQISRMILKRDKGLATRLLYQPGIPRPVLEQLRKSFNLRQAGMMEGGVYHNLKDLMGFPVRRQELSDTKWPPLSYRPINGAQSVFDSVAIKDLMFHPPYHSYNTILRFFNEASTDSSVKEIYVTLYRVASDSLLANALINAARNGKKVQVVLELKARFDEANNVRWAKKMKEAGVELIYSPVSLKVHAKIAFVKRVINGRMKYTGLLATGNFNENTASIYTDHVLMTAHPGILREMELLFIFLARKEKPPFRDLIDFRYLLVAQFNLQRRFIELIDREIAFARNGRPASIVIKLNNLEEKKLIEKLYEASQAGVRINLIVRSICCLVPGVKGMSENITVRRIVGRYLEHGRVFIFNNDGDQEVFLGSADWMNRNIYRRIEVCFPLLDSALKKEITDIVEIQLNDNKKAVYISPELDNIPAEAGTPGVDSQFYIYRLLQEKSLSI